MLVFDSRNLLRAERANRKSRLVRKDSGGGKALDLLQLSKSEKKPDTTLENAGNHVSEKRMKKRARMKTPRVRKKVSVVNYQKVTTSSEKWKKYAGRNRGIKKAGKSKGSEKSKSFSNLPGVIK